ncbi:MAG: hypothetical protein GEU92_10695 [Alphaproteobacteria bacterium]|nr:hypothetical protein [Alphaproteobacteria bacterium]
MSDNLVPLDLSAFSRADLEKIRALGEKQRLLYRWFRSERKTESGCDRVFLYSGSRGRTPYASYCVTRHRDGHYELRDGRGGRTLTTARTLDEAIGAIPDDFYYSN